jgi:hypothetical protein
MQRPTLARVQALKLMAVSPPPMYTWPIHLKRAILIACGLFCIAAYVAMAAGLLALATLLIGFI